jgi:hypothetical protein
MEREEKLAKKRAYMNALYANLSEEEREKKRQRQREWYAANKEKAIETNKKCYYKRKEKDPESLRIQGLIRSKRHYYKDLEHSRAKGREAAKRRRELRGDHHKAVKFKYQYGITIEQRNALFEAQGYKCAICLSPEPNCKAGWNTDHCHRTGVVRFILCAHCNRGLGAFKDNPEIMRRAADMLQEFYNKHGTQDQADAPVAAIMEPANA